MGQHAQESTFKNINSKLSDFNWIQTARYNFGIGSDVNKPTEINDPSPADDKKPFYWRDDELKEENTRVGFDARFHDTPVRYPKAGQNVYWNGELSLVGKNSNGNYRSLITLLYGFDITKKGKVNIHSIKVISPSKFQLHLIKIAK